MRHPGLRTAPLFPALAFFAVIVFASGLAAAESYTYIVVLHERVAAGEQAEPDVEALGGEVLHRSRNRRVVRVPAEAARALAAHRAVSYMQRVQTEGEVPAPPQSIMIASNLVATNDSTPPTWESGDYVYDGDGNITAIGADTYAYDTASRLVNASLTDGTTQSEGYAYDSFGNLVETTRSASPSTATPASKATNRLTNVTYDSAGNVTTSESGTTQYFYDGFNMLRFMDTSAPGTGIYYVYTADDERVGVNDYGEKRWMIRDLSGKVLREWEATNGPWWVWREDYVYRSGSLVAAERELAEGGTRHYHIDHLGTARLITDQSSRKISLHDYFPYGVEKTDFRQEMLDRGTHWPNSMKFTGHERDFIGGTSTNNRNQLDYMHARYHNAVFGRFLSIDPILGEPSRPQTWNRYVYATNNPVILADPKGMYVTNCGSNSDCQLQAALFEGERHQALQSNDAAVRAAAAAYGDPGVENGVLVAFGPTSNGDPAETDASSEFGMQMVLGPAGRNGQRHIGSSSPVPFWGVTVTFDGVGAISGTNVAHEGVHVQHALRFFNSWNGATFDDSLRMTSYSTESAAYHVTAAFTPPNGTLTVGGTHVFRSGMNAQRRQAVIDAILRDPALRYRVTPENQGTSWPR